MRPGVCVCVLDWILDNNVAFNAWLIKTIWFSNVYCYSKQEQSNRDFQADTQIQIS